MITHVNFLVEQQEIISLREALGLASKGYVPYRPDQRPNPRFKSPTRKLRLERHQEAYSEHSTSEPSIRYQVPQWVIGVLRKEG